MLNIQVGETKTFQCAESTDPFTTRVIGLCTEETVTECFVYGRLYFTDDENEQSSLLVLNYDPNKLSSKYNEIIVRRIS